MIFDSHDCARIEEDLAWSRHDEARLRAENEALRARVGELESVHSAACRQAGIDVAAIAAKDARIAELEALVALPMAARMRPEGHEYEESPGAERYRLGVSCRWCLRTRSEHARSPGGVA